ncbi:MAG TPA: hypothetical protein VH763_10380 [Gemmatimonadales bacterium]|jgi:hypothetical protein
MRPGGLLPFGGLLIRHLLTLPLLLWGEIAGAQSDWHEVPAGNAHRSGSFANPKLSESSGVAVSRKYPGVLWSINDSGNPAWLFATDTLGRDRGIFAVSGATNFDWEAISLARCGSADCIYLGDTGDNRGQRTSVRLYRVPEPLPKAAGGREASTAPAEHLEVRYPDGPHDVEAIYADQAGNCYLITKGERGSVTLYQVPGSAWKVGHAVAKPLGGLPIQTAWLGGKLVTDAALAPDGQRVAVRTYQTVFLFRRSPDGRLLPERGRPACSVAKVDVQGEGVAWLDPQTLVLTSESTLGYPGTISVLQCPPAATGASD